jgi:hypothetical protein
MNRLNDFLNDYKISPSIPYDGIVMGALVYWLSPPDDKIRNTIAVSLVHGILHKSITDRLCEYGKEKVLNSNFRLQQEKPRNEMTLTANKPSMFNKAFLNRSNFTFGRNIKGINNPSY